MSNSLKFKPHVQERLKKLQAFWRVSKAYNNRSSEVITTGEAIAILNDGMTNIDPNSKISWAASNLQHEIIIGGKNVRRKARK